MLDMKFVRENPELVRENIKKKFQDAKLPLVDEVLELDEKKRAAITEASELRAQRNTLSKQVGMPSRPRSRRRRSVWRSWKS